MDFISISQPFSVISKIEIRYVAFFVFVDALYGDFDSCCVLYPFDSLIHQTMPTSIGFFALGKKFMRNFMDASSSSSTKKMWVRNLLNAERLVLTVTTRIL